ncbi:MAG: endonuclease domain-containing protein [Acidobacteria bacterium]|nr:MAG: endonuclease domain-containing protein [Acidobacteriota bacterium]
MRRAPTDAESKLWLFLRDRRLGGWRFRRQYFIGEYILDFYCAEARLAVELDGGGHSEDEKIAADNRRTAALEGRGIREQRVRQGPSSLPSPPPPLPSRERGEKS